MSRLQRGGKGLLQRHVNEIVVDEPVAIQVGEKTVASEEEENAVAGVFRAGKDDCFVGWVRDNTIAVDQLVANGSTHR